MLEEAERHLEALSQCLESLDPGTLTPDDARRVLDLGTSIEQTGRWVTLRVATKAVQGAPWQEEGYRSPASWFADTTRTSVPEAVSTLTTSERLAELPATGEALRRGVLSPTEAKSVCAAAIADPSSEAELLAEAPSVPTSILCRQARNMAMSGHDHDPEHRRKVHSRRFFRIWTDAEGMSRFSGGVTPDVGVELLSAVRSRAAHVFDEALLAGLPLESQAAYDADALVALATGDDRRATFHGPEGGRSRSADIWFLVDAAGFRRGELVDGETCEVPGVGPVPLSVIEHMVGKAGARYIVTDGVDVTTVAHAGRIIPAPVRTAVFARDRGCVVPNCRVTLGLEIDHWQVPFARGGLTALWNLACLCRFHHRLKTYDGYELSGGPGKWEWLAPDGGGAPDDP